ncbi:hypothetical protein J3Q64DRAFT_1825070 [Phycomyces blakesleeanus]|uniref:Uncharacterized protein n=2 Tax=Phycomyces blakesleeanus TaxID=4837 RepID=A0A163APW0_PHYB8|nr:hypothetical protein PHYBLDRAFT_78879 [Phycomyces blakesleeanus NRRL 1555(-)]OAD74981.1 hypothetical protein PHYBLDRAFT_78879 [Phycomyces blakesleeanus NRRL 1555(-)]|eukprot:XP_018293021.1 hypothetical protein PHYBLDRAFT_78879 [Phycomyces blakesleeanus NRRL 1555(-)]
MCKLNCQDFLQMPKKRLMVTEKISYQGGLLSIVELERTQVTRTTIEQFYYTRCPGPLFLTLHSQMYFHSSSSRHEQYASMRSKRLHSKSHHSLSSNTSGVDSGYTSSASGTPSPTTSEAHTEGHISRPSIDSPPSILSIVTESSLATDTTSATSPKKKLNRPKKAALPPRHPDLVYSCPRPLAFPFHNDGHFLPVAEADPRDVARITPSRALPSIKSGKASTIVSAPFDHQSSFGSIHYEVNDSRIDTASISSRSASILSSVQRGTVRSLRSLFQIPSTNEHECTTHPDRLPRLEIKRGTVQTLRDLFVKRQTTPVTPSYPHQDVHHATSKTPFVSQPGFSSSATTQSSNSTSASRRFKDLFNFRSSQKMTNPKPQTQAQAQTQTQTQTQTTPSKPPVSRSSAFAARNFWVGRTDNERSSKKTASVAPLPTTPHNYPKVPTTPPTANRPIEVQVPKQKKTIKSEIKKLFSRKESPAPVPAPTEAQIKPSVALPEAVATPAPRRSFFPTLKRDNSVAPRPQEPVKPKQVTAEPVQPQPTQAPLTVGRMWKSFKKLIGKKSSRVGVI